MYLQEALFIEEVSKAFRFLKDLNYKEIGFEMSSSNRGYYYYYQSEHIIVRVHYSLTNDWIDVEFIYESDNLRVFPGGNNSIHLMNYLPLKGVYSYDTLMPKSIGFVQSVKLVGDLVKEHAMPIILGKEKVVFNDLRKRRNQF